jgi:hypothetical protein
LAHTQEAKPNALTKNPLNNRFFLLQRVAYRAIPGKFLGVASLASHGFRNRYGHITAGLQAVNKGMSEHLGPKVQVPHVLVECDGVRVVADFRGVLRHQPFAFSPYSTGAEMRMPLLSCIRAARRDGIEWLSKSSLTLYMCSKLIGAMARDNSPSPRMYKRLKGLSRSITRCFNAMLTMALKMLMCRLRLLASSPRAS